MLGGDVDVDDKGNIFVIRWCTLVVERSAVLIDVIVVGVCQRFRIASISETASRPSPFELIARATSRVVSVNPNSR